MPLQMFSFFRHRAARVDNYETALEKLHEDFDWPFPGTNMFYFFTFHVNKV